LSAGFREGAACTFSEGAGDPHVCRNTLRSPAPSKNAHATPSRKPRGVWTRGREPLLARFARQGAPMGGGDEVRLTLSRQIHEGGAPGANLSLAACGRAGVSRWWRALRTKALQWGRLL
jgi:hypothetical protein